MAAPLGNRFAAGLTNNGKPPAYDKPEEMLERINSYFALQAKDGLPVTISGLAFHLGFTSRQSIYDYKEKEDFAYIIKQTVLFIESNYENNLHGPSPTGSIFALKNMGWRDKSEQEISGSVHLTDRPVIFK